MTRRFAFLAVVLLVVRLALMAFTPVFEPSEARYAAISANMARSGDFVVPRFTHDGVYQSFDGKPPLVFQAGGLCCRLFGAESPVALQFGVRLFPLLSALLLLAILRHAVRKSSDAATADLAVAVCATTTAFYASAGIAMTDMSLACCVAGSLLLYKLFAETRQLRYAFGVAALQAAGMLVKGPVALALFGLPVLADAIVNRRWKAIFTWHWLAAAPLYFLIAVPWFVLIEQRNPGSVLYFFYNENFLRFVTHDYGDKYGSGREAFRGVAIVWAFVATLPWALLPLAALYRRIRSHRLFANLRDSLGFEGVAVLAITLFWCLTSRVLIYYLFPVMPLFAAWLVQHADRRIIAKCVPWAALITLLVTVGALVGGTFASDKMEGPKSFQYYGYSNRYAHEFYHGTSPKCANGNSVSFEQFGREFWEARKNGK